MKLFYKEVLSTNSIGELLEIERLLKCKEMTICRRVVTQNFYKIRFLLSVFGKIRDDLNVENQYYLYVSPKKKEEADSLINEWRLSQRYI